MLNDRATGKTEMRTVLLPANLIERHRLIKSLVHLRATQYGNPELDSTAVFAEAGGPFSRFAGPMITIVMAISSLGAVAYLFHRAGFFG